MRGWYKKNSVFVWTLLIAIGVIVFGAAYSSTLSEISGAFMSRVSYYFGWLYILSIVAFIGFCLWISLSKFGKVKLGKDDNFYFLEINFRNSTWSYAHTVEGINLPIIWAKSMLAGRLETEDVVVRKDRFTAMQEFTDFKDSVIGRQCSLWQWIKDVRCCDSLFYYNRNDKKPFWNFLISKILK